MAGWLCDVGKEEEAEEEEEEEGEGFVEDKRGCGVATEAEKGD